MVSQNRSSIYSRSGGRGRTVLGLWDGRLRRAAALVSVEQTFDNLPSNETIICVVGVVSLACRRSASEYLCGGWVDVEGWNGGTKAATRATLISVLSYVENYPSLVMHATSRRTRDRGEQNMWA